MLMISIWLVAVFYPGPPGGIFTPPRNFFWPPRVTICVPPPVGVRLGGRAVARLLLGGWGYNIIHIEHCSDCERRKKKKKVRIFGGFFFRCTEHPPHYFLPPPFIKSWIKHCT